LGASCSSATRTELPSALRRATESVRSRLGAATVSVSPAASKSVGCSAARTRSRRRRSTIRLWAIVPIHVDTPAREGSKRSANRHTATNTSCVASEARPSSRSMRTASEYTRRP
jgi:hypothetical protein